MKIKIKLLRENSKLPIKGSKQAACYDVFASEITKEHNLVDIKLGFSTEIPKGYKGIIVPRSNFTQKGWVMENSPAQIDSDYRGEWMIKFEAIPINIDKYQFNWLEYQIFPYEVGDRVAQIFIEKVNDFEFEEVESLENTERGTGGFGSTGINKIVKNEKTTQSIKQKN